jgi:cation diffusion facilitator CzcD-associated flavoprotein CzcO
MNHPNRPEKAVVVGGSMAGLLAAAALVPHFDRITIVERDRLPAGPEFRRGVLDVPTPRMGLTEEPTHIWEIPEPVPFEFPLPSHEPAVPVHAPA